MSKYFSSKSFLSGSIILSFLMIIFTEPTFKWLHQGAFNSIEESILQPIFYLCIAIVFSSLVLFTSSRSIFKNWFRKVFIWFLPVSLLLIFSTGVDGGIPQPGRSVVAAWLGTLLGIITILFVAFQRLYFKVK